MLIEPSTRTRRKTMAMRVICAAGSAILAGALSFPMLISAPAMAGEAAPSGTAGPARLPLPHEADPDGKIAPDPAGACRLDLTRTG